MAKHTVVNELTKRKRTLGALENFKSLPQECQLLFFAMLDTQLGKYNPDTFYDFILATEFDYSDCDSPIEIMFAMAIDFLLFARMVGITEVNRQEEIKTDNNIYRVDFEIKEYTKGLKIVVECDGHDFHEKTKEQVIQRDNRDYELKMAGYEVFHFSGSEIFNAPLASATKVLRYIERKIGDECKENS